MSILGVGARERERELKSTDPNPPKLNGSVG